VFRKVEKQHMQLTLEGRFSAGSGGAPWIVRSAVPAPGMRDAEER
jgi:hypothetical protein